MGRYDVSSTAAAGVQSGIGIIRNPGADADNNIFATKPSKRLIATQLECHKLKQRFQRLHYVESYAIRGVRI